MPPPLSPTARPVAGSNAAAPQGSSGCSARRRIALPPNPQAALRKATADAFTPAAACARPARSVPPSGCSAPSDSGAHQGRDSTSSACCAGRGVAEAGAPGEPLALGVRLNDREPE